LAKQTSFQGSNLYRTDMLERDQEGKLTGKVSTAWAKNFQQAALQMVSPVAGNPPPHSASPAVQGQLATDGVYLYIATGPNTWKRIPLAAF
jgi:hypothetical protein